MITCTRRFQFCAGHRVLGHEGKCAHLHGHNYVALVTAEADQLDPLGRVIDFGVLKARIGSWLDDNWDHGFVAHRDDTAVKAALRAASEERVFWLDCNPTAENLARHLLHVVCPQVLAGTGVRAVKVVLWETENCCAEVAL